MKYCTALRPSSTYQSKIAKFSIFNDIKFISYFDLLLQYNDEAGAGRVHLCRVTGNTVLSHKASDVTLTLK